ncbi:MAG TPA: SDR family NAD(P)-dependent oxidoreductase [Desulfurella acetivorans]|uniref:SDR family NAD(P)-dependent oxidoreductase n=1 Tax=Desulfurella acetivorans TaxID=33002 RepID=A0A7C6A6H7_DESAE|nr:SDR family NAD(P)-dependent oxidoreductase [Desulfurella acetivorans]
MGSVLITGTSSGIGKACAEIFAKNGYNLILNARITDKLEAIANKLKSDKVKVFYKKTDMSNKEDIFEFVESIPKDFYPIDVLINNAGLSRGIEPLDQGNIDDWGEMIDTNIKSVLIVTKLIIPIMKKQGYGHIINKRQRLQQVGGSFV